MIRLGRDNTGAAALEFAILAPVFAVIMIGIVDFSFAFYSKLQLASAVSTGAQYAYINGQSLTSSTVATFLTNVQNVVKSASALSLPTPTVMYNNSTTNANANNCYCISVSPQTWTATTCGNACSGTNSQTAGKFVSITGTYTYTPIFATDQFLKTGAMTESAIVRVQ
jgi:Flp pilus assembly protein TadG